MAVICWFAVVLILEQDHELARRALGQTGRGYSARLGRLVVLAPLI
jgi:hypothetical protein